MVINVRGLTKRYRDVVAVDDISFDVEAGSLFAFLGTNGAGKTTTIGCLTTALPYDAGELTVAGHDVRDDGDAVRREIGVVFQESVLDATLSVRENLAVRARAYLSDRAAIAARIDELAALIGIVDFMKRPYGKLSGGQRRRVDIARALLPSPSIVFLDEPTEGLDPASRATVWSTIRELRRNAGLTVFLTTHYMEETEQADRVCIIDHGRIVAEGTPPDLRARYSSSVLTITTHDRSALTALLAASGLVPAATRESGDGVVVEVAVPDAATAKHVLAAHGDDIADFEFRHGRMDDVFLALTGHGEEHADARG